MAYFSNLPLVQYPSRFKNQSSNEDYVEIRNIFRRAKIREDVASYITAFTYYQIRENERPDEIAERVYGNPDLDWIILITNNIINYPSQWALNNNNLYEYLIDKYGTDEKLKEIKYLETNEVRDEYNRLVVPANLKVDPDTYEEFTTISNKTNPLYYDIKRYPVPSKYYPLEITTNLGQYIEVWERDNLGENESYKGEKYGINDILLNQKEIDGDIQIGNQTIPKYARIDFSYLNVYDRNEKIKQVFNPITLKGWPYTWGAIVQIFNRDSTITQTPILSRINTPVDITNDSRLYAISYLESIDTIEYSTGTVLEDKANQIYTVGINEDLTTNGIGTESIFKIKRNSLGEIIKVDLQDGGREFVENEIITIDGSLIGGKTITDDLIITVDTVKPRPQFRFISIGDPNNVPYPGVKITIFNETGISYLNTVQAKVDVFNNENQVSNYDYEIELNENNRKLLILRPEYIGAFVADFNNIMRYDNTTETLTSTLKRTYNPNIIGQ